MPPSNYVVFERIVAFVVTLSLVMCGCNVQNFAYAGEADDAKTDADEVSVEELLTECSGPSDPNYLRITENIVAEGLADQLDTSQYIVEGVQARYISQEYLDELAYNSQANVYFGYTLEELDAMFTGTRYVFDLGDDGQTTVHEFEGYVDEFAQTMSQVVGNVAVGAGILTVCAIIAPIRTTASPILAFFILNAVQNAPSFALGGAVLGGVVSGVVTGVQTGSVSQAFEAAAVGASEDFKWGAIIGATAGAPLKWLGMRAAEVVGTKLSLTALVEAVGRGQFKLVSPKCYNTSLAGLRHPATGVEFAERYIVQRDGRTVVRGVFPKFESTFEAKLPASMFKNPSSTQFKECNRQLAQALERNPELRNRFSDNQLAQIADGLTPEGYTWHHNEQEGVLQLVDSATHAATAHTGGNSIWGNAAATL